MKFAKFLCEDCGVVFVAMSDRHRVDYCPKCKEQYVDYEEGCCRASQGVRKVDSFDPPWFDDEDDYHSALMGWLNDSDERFELKKLGRHKVFSKGTLIVERQSSNSKTVEGAWSLVRMMQHMVTDGKRRV